MALTAAVAGPSMYHAWLLMSPQRQTLSNCEVATVELIRVGDALEAKPAVAKHYDLRPDHATLSSQAAVFYDSPGAGWADPGPGQEHLRHA
jgi:hypothetical protein